ncbi:MAG TPA: sigma 54-interacting transcriptional regulator, partial [Acidobacteriota bacterium]|nr:sigma 54-interacting transcriptional regulator [Acidobacteriota bacterium]
RRVGGTTTRQADLRIVAATNTDLWEATRQGRFREDLFFRLSVIVLTVPPLRKRKEDIPVLAEYFLERIDYGDKPKYLSPEVLESLTDYDWPGNVRELRNVIERTALLSDGEVVEPTDLRMLPTVAERIIKLLTEDDQLVTLRELQSRYIRYVLGKVKGHQQQASKILDIDPKTIYRNIRKD